MADWWLYPFDQAILNSLGSDPVVKTLPTTFASLPSAATAGIGARAFVTDCNTAVFMATAAAGGANKVTVHSDGTNWIVG